MQVLDAERRRKAIVKLLKEGEGALPGGKIGEKFEVSRQVIVQDIALLRQAGLPIVGTAKGYVMDCLPEGRLIKVRHQGDQSCKELMAFVDAGVEVLDVLVNHRVYGKISAPLAIRSRGDVESFREQLAGGISSPLLQITDGYHYHHILASQEHAYADAEKALRLLGFWVDMDEEERTRLEGQHSHGFLR